MGRKPIELPDWFTEEYVNNHTANQIAERYGSSTNNIFGICNARNWRPLPARTVGYTGILDSLKDTIITMTASEVSKEYKIPAKTIWAWCRSRGVKIARRRKEKQVKPKNIIKGGRRNKEEFSLTNKQSHGTVGFGYCNVQPRNRY